MKSILGFLIILFCNVFSLVSQTFDVENIKVSGDNNKRINLVFMGDGYTLSQLDDFISDVTKASNSLFSQSPFLEYANYFNVYAIKVISKESGTDHPGTATDVVEPVINIETKDTYFNTSFDTSNLHRLLYTFDSATVYDVLAESFPEYDQPIILVNSPEYGGAGGPYATASTGTNSDEIFIHELGHSLFNLKDEYYPGDILADEAINMSKETNTNLVRWKNWVGSHGIGVYPYGTSESESTWNRPHQNCKMRYLNVPFCAVCKEGIIETIHHLVAPIDAFSPSNNTISPSTFPLQFQLDLIKPNPNTLNTNWSLNGINIATNVDAISIEETDLTKGTNTITTVVNDTSSFLRVNTLNNQVHNHNDHVYTVTWTVNYTALGINDIVSAINKYNIYLHPNPVNDILNIKVESDATFLNLSVDIISIEGKKVKSVLISNYENQQINISDLSQGIYITNIYSKGVLITSKKLVKN